jgi:hypothetical protein
MTDLDQRLTDARALWEARLDTWANAEEVAKRARDLAVMAEEQNEVAKWRAHEAAKAWVAVTNAIAERDADDSQLDECVQCGEEARTHEGSCVKCK